jgi:hypothetical protein
MGRDIRVLSSPEIWIGTPSRGSKFRGSQDWFREFRIDGIGEG